MHIKYKGMKDLLTGKKRKIFRQVYMMEDEWKLKKKA